MNMNNLMAQAKKMQQDIERKQKEIYETEYTGSSQLVDVVVTGDKRISQIKIKDLNSFDAEDKEILEDMIKIAINDAYDKVDADVDSKLGMYGKQMGGLF